MSVRRIYVEKRPDYAVRADELTNEFRNYLSLSDVKVRELVRYDVENLTDEVFEEAIVTVFSEPPVDIVYKEEFPYTEDEFVFSVEYLPGQFDQRADSAEQCVKLLDDSSEPIIRSAVTYAVSGTLSEEDKKVIEAYVINPVESRLVNGANPETQQQTLIYCLQEKTVFLAYYRFFHPEDPDESNNPVHHSLCR